MDSATVPRRFQDQPAFTRLGVLHLLNALGDACITVALANSVFFSVSVSTARGRIALSLLLTMLPFGIIAPFLGPWMDRNSKRRYLMLLVSLMGRAIIALFIIKYLKSWLFFPCAFISLVCSRSYSVIKAGLVPNAVQDESQLVQANAKLTMIGVFGGLVAGLVCAGILRFLHSSAVVLSLGCLLFIAASIASLRLERKVVPKQEYVASERVSLPNSISLAGTAMSGLRGMVGFITFSIAFALRRQHRNPLEFGFVLAASLLGSFLGALFAPPLRKIIREERMLEAALAFVMVAALASYQVGGVLGAMILTFTLAGASTSGRMAFDSLVQRDAPRARHGNTFSRIEAGLQISWVVGALVAVLIPFRLKASLAVLAAGCALIIVLYILGGYAFVLRKYIDVRARRARQAAEAERQKSLSENEISTEK